MCYPHIFSFLSKAPPLFCYYHSLLEHQKHRLGHPLFYLIFIRLYLPECSICIHSLHYRESCPCCSSPYPLLGPYPTTSQTLTAENLNLIQKIVELTQPKSTTHCATHRSTGWPPLPKLFPSPNIGNDAINSTPCYFSLSFQFRLLQGKQFKPSFFENVHNILPFRCSIYSSYIPCT